MSETVHPESTPVVFRTLATIHTERPRLHLAGKSTATTFQITMPWLRPPLNLNQRPHWAKKARITADIRRDVGWLLKAARIPAASHVTVCMFYAPGDRQERDVDNLTLTTKPIFDAVADVGIVPKDTPEFMAKLMPVIVPPPEPGPRCWLTVEITPKTEES